MFVLVMLPMLMLARGGPVKVLLGSPAGTVRETFVGFTTDWWSNSSSMATKWGDAGSQNFDTGNPKLILLASALTPATWRTGGTPADCVLYQHQDGTWPPGCPSQGSMPIGCPVCLSVDRLKKLCEFARAIARRKLDWYFGLNAMYGRATKTGPMDTSQIRSMLATASSLGCPVTNWELGNELVETQKVLPAALGKDITRVSKLIESVPWHAATRPGLVGIDSSIGAAELIREAYANSSGLVEYTFHMYSARAGSPQCTSDALASLATVQVAERQLDAVVTNFANTISSCGECGSCYGGGGPNSSDTFASAFWYLTSLGHASRLGFERFLRSTLIGGDYELIDHETMLPNPDYYVALLWTKLMGIRSFNSSTDSPSTRAYFHCDRLGQGGLVGALFNVNSLESATFDFDVNLKGAQVYEMRSANGKTDSRLACLVDANRRCHPLIFNGTAIPPLQAVPLSKLTLLPQSYAFISFPHARVAVCA